MQNTIQMPLVHVMGTATGAGHGLNTASSPSGDGFLAKLTAVLAGDQVQDVTSNHSEQAIIAKLFAQLAGDILPEEEMNLEQLISEFMPLLMQSSDELQQMIVAQPELQQWLTKAVQLLDEAALNHNGSKMESSGQLQSGLLQSTSNTTVQTDVNLAQMQKVIAEFLNAAQQPSSNALLQEHAQALKVVLKPLLVVMQQSSQSSAFEQAVLSTMNGSPTENASGQGKLHGMLQHLNNRIQLNQASVIAPQSDNSESTVRMPVMTLGVESSLELNNRTGSTLVHQMIQPVGTAESTLSGDKVAVASMENTLNQSLSQTQETVRPVAVETSVKAQQTYVNAQLFAEQAGPFVIKHMKIAQLNGVSEARISLVPEHLGHVNIHIAMKNGQMVAQFMTESLAGKQLLEGQLSQLRNVLQEQGIQVQKLEVVQGQQSGLYQEQREQQATKHQTLPNKNRRPDYDRINDDFSLDFREDTTKQSRIYGSSFEAVI